MKRILLAIAVIAFATTAVIAANPDGKEGKCCKAKTECSTEKKCDKECKEACQKGDKKCCDKKEACCKEKKECPKKK